MKIGNSHGRTINRLFTQSNQRKKKTANEAKIVYFSIQNFFIFSLDSLNYTLYIQ